MIDLPDVVRAKAEVTGATKWLDDLPALVRGLERGWSFRLGRIHDEGTEALVADVEMDDGTPAVLKVLVPRDDDAVANEITVLDVVGGDACPTMFRSDLERRAILMERLGPSLFSERRPVDERHEILCDVAQRLWRPLPGGVLLPTGADKGKWLIDFIVDAWERLGRPTSRKVIEHALECAGRRIDAHDDDLSLLVHGDVHEWNALRSSDGYKLIDPDGLLAEPEYDLGIIMREDPVELLDGDPLERAERLAAMTGRDPIAIWEWGVVERLSTGLTLTEICLEPLASQMLTAAERVAALGTGM